MKPLPTETELARQFEVNRSTVREALRKLESSGLLGRRRGGKRLFVTRPTREAVGGGLSQALALHRARVVDVWEALAGRAAGHRGGRGGTAFARPRSAKLSASAQRFAARAGERDAAVGDVADFFDALAEAGANPVFNLLNEPLLRLLKPSLAVIIDRVPQARSRIEAAQRADRPRSALARREVGRRMDDAPCPRLPPRLRSGRDRPRDRGRRAAGRHAGDQLISIATAVASPPPMHSAASPRFLPWRFRA